MEGETSDSLIETAADFSAPQFQQLSKLFSCDSPHLHFHISWSFLFLPNVKDEPRQRLARGVREHDS
jgi:hypothetical protein